MKKGKGKQAFTGRLTNEQGTKQFYAAPDGKQGVRSPMSPTGKREDGQMDAFMRRSAATKAYEILRMEASKNKIHPLNTLWEKENKTGKKEKRLCDRFYSANMKKTMPAIGLSPQEYAKGNCVVGPYQVSEGTLPSIQITDGKSNIRIGDLQIGPETTVGELSQAIVKENENWEEGDELWFVVMMQWDWDGEPKAKAMKICMELDYANEEKVVKEFQGIGFVNEDGMLARKTKTEPEGYCWVHKGVRDEKWKVSTQQLYVEGNREMLDKYQSPEMWEKAAQGYREQGKERDEKDSSLPHGGLTKADIKEAVKEAIVEAMREVMAEFWEKKDMKA